MSGRRDFRTARLGPLTVLVCLLAGAGGARDAAAKGVNLYAVGGELFFLGGNQEKVENAPAAGGRVEYNFARHDIMSVGLSYLYGKAGIQDTETLPFDAFLEQHFCYLSYRIAKSWRWLSLGSYLGVGAVVKNYTDVPVAENGRVVLKQGTSAEYAMHLSLFGSFRPFTWLSIGPDFSYMMTTDMDKWVFGGESSYFFLVGGHLGVHF